VQISDTHLDGVAAHDHHAVGGELGKACHDWVTARGSRFLPREHSW